MVAESNSKVLTELVNEITKDSFDAEKVKGLLSSLNIPYSEDPIALLNSVLEAIHRIPREEGPYV